MQSSTHLTPRAHAPERTIVTLSDLPDYPADLAERVERSLTELPGGQVWFTYRDIRRHFGVSRATLARRMKAGVVPGIVMSGDQVVEEGPVRRFDRLQLKWLLLAVRSGRRDMPDVLGS